ncbi:MAG: helix-hairpin-helix domain-containing protein [Saprospiraceae bacterium]|nr:helix-hairpin-helix domain-containing protein [Saprospiraceae bacterium]
MPRPSRIAVLLALLLGAVAVDAQEPVETISELLEQLAESLELDGALDYNTVLEQLEFLAASPININDGDLEELVGLGLITASHQLALRLYIARNGALISIYELQAVPGFDLAVISRIRPFITVREKGSGDEISGGSLLTGGINELFMRWGYTLEDQRGFEAREDGTVPFEGDKHRLYVRYRHRNGGRLSYGITMEKDPGEAFFGGSTAHGFDFYSAHFFVRDYRSWLPRVALGDYSVNLGQGLLLHSGFGFGKSAFVTQIKKGGYKVRPFTSVNEVDFLRGGAMVIQPREALQITIFGSSKRRDANTRTDTIDTGSSFLIANSFSSLQTSGLHRTDAEIEDERQIDHTVAGMNATYTSGRLEVGINAVCQTFSQPLIRAEQAYNRYRFSGTRLGQVSIEYTWLWRNLHVFGETARSDNGALATINGLLMALHPRVDLAILSRVLARDFHTIAGNTFGETSDGFNESGIYFGVVVRPLDGWTVSAYADTWQHPWLRFNVDAPSTGNEQLVRLTYQKRRKFEWYLQYRNEIKERNQSGNTSATDYVVPHRKRNLRVHFDHQLGDGIALRNRLELSFYKEGQGPESRGYLIYQDVLYRPIGSPFSFTTRIAYFDTDDYNSRIYAFENDLINQFYIPAYTYRGVRYYVNLKYQGFRDITLEFRIAQTRLTNRGFISSGNNLIAGNKRTDLKAQVKWVF